MNSKMGHPASIGPTNPIWGNNKGSKTTSFFTHEKADTWPGDVHVLKSLVEV